MANNWINRYDIAIIDIGDFSGNVVGHFLPNDIKTINKFLPLI
jgi:hypothetical protein